MKTALINRNLPIVAITADPGGEDVDVADLLAAIEPHRSTGARVQFSGHIRLGNDFELMGFQNFQFVGVGEAIIEQKNAYADATSFGLTKCQNISVSNLKLYGAGIRPDGKVPQQNGLRIKRSSDIHVSNCIIEPATRGGTIKHAISVQDSSHRIWLRDNRIRKATGSGIIVGSGIWPHPTDPADFKGHKCSNVRVEGNDIETVGVAVVIDDATAVSWVVGNRIKLSFGHGVVIEDGSIWFEVAGNTFGPSRGAAVVIGHGQTNLWASRGVVANNMAAGCNNGSIEPPSGFFGVDPMTTAFFEGEGGYVVLSSNVAVSAG